MFKIRVCNSHKIDSKSRTCLNSLANKYDKFQVLIYITQNEKLRMSSANLMYQKDLLLNETIKTSLSMDNISVIKTQKKDIFVHTIILPEGEDIDLSNNIYKISFKINKFMELQSTAFNLVKNKTSLNSQSTNAKGGYKVNHMLTDIFIHVVDESRPLLINKFPQDLGNLIKINSNREYLPILYMSEIDFLQKRYKPVTEVLSNQTALPLITIQPISLGKLRLFATLQQSIASMKKLGDALAHNLAFFMAYLPLPRTYFGAFHEITNFKSDPSVGFTDKDTDEIKSLFVDTNLYLLLLTFVISFFHMMFDVLAFKNDISFWKNRDSMAGISSKTVVWRCFSQFVVFLYLCDERTSLLVLIPTGIGALIEAWKVTKALKYKITFGGPGCVLGFRVQKLDRGKDEQLTQAYDDEALKYLSYLMYPLCLGGAIYSLLYLPHKSWYSWIINSMVNGVYAFGFIFMLPQLIINYKMKSVAHLPWRAFMYKAFNTFIDDVFAFIITMPTTHRLACFRDDLIFLCYLYQRWLYPVDKSRVNEFGQSFHDKKLAPTKAKITADHIKAE